VADRIRLRLDSDLAALLGAEHLRQLKGISVPFRCNEEETAARVEDVEFGDGGFFVTLVVDEEMPPGTRLIRPPGQSLSRVRR
jgi:hypothetical protein